MTELSDNTYATLERELAMFTRRAEATRIAFLIYKNMDRSTYLMLHELQERGPLGIKSLADALLLDISTASRQTSVLEQRGYVQRVSGAHDARVKLLGITESGLQQLREIRSARERFYTELLKDWTDTEREAFTELVAKFNRTTGQHLEEYRNFEDL